jgi:outer membrane protein OmpA-like peptidoglycan-associated protein
MMTPDESIALEHRTRSIRLRRLVSELGIQPPPQFYEYVIPALVMPADFRHDTPVLRVVFPENSFFDTAHSEVIPTAQPIVEAMAEMLQGDVPDVALFVAGHTDSRGPEDYNHNLSVRRAQSVAAALRAAGADAPDIWAVGFGESLPLYENSSPQNMAYNRRVEFLFSAKPEAGAEWLKNQMDLACSESAGDARLRCLTELKPVTRTYVVESVDRSVVEAPAQGGRVEAPVRGRVATAALPHRQIVINLSTHTYVVKRADF